jgi:hypothetical protein
MASKQAFEPELALALALVPGEDILTHQTQRMDSIASALVIALVEPSNPI